LYISEVKIAAYRFCKDEFVLPLKKGLTVIVGENGTGKSTMVDAIRLMLMEDEYGRAGASERDFFRPYDSPARKQSVDNFQIDCMFNDLNDEERVAYLPWLDANDPKVASLHLRISNREGTYGKLKRTIWGGFSVRGIFEWDLLELIHCVYLPPLRDAQDKLRAYRGSRLARLMKNLKGDTEEEHPLVGKLNQRNKELLEDDTIKKANTLIRNSLIEAVGDMFGQQTLIQFSEESFERIVENLRLLYYPEITGGETPPENFRELSENSLGYNNLLYLATVIAEMEGSIPEDKEILRVLLIEEPEAHLHPQLQTRVLQYLQDVARRNNIQVILTTHSPVIVAAVELDSLVVLSLASCSCSPSAVDLSSCGLDGNSKFFIERWLDITKSTLFFSRGVLLVEGIAEALLVPVFAKRIIKNKVSMDKTLDDYGVSVINIGGIYFKQFMQLFRGEKKAEDGSLTACGCIPTRCAGITDFDPDKQAKPHESNPCTVSGNHQHYLVAELANNANCRLFTNLKTLEYDLALEGNNLAVMAQILVDMTSTNGNIKKTATSYTKKDWNKVTEPEKAEAAYWLYRHIDEKKGEFAQNLTMRIENNEVEFSVPLYIEQAILWAIRYGG